MGIFLKIELAKSFLVCVVTVETQIKFYCYVSTALHRPFCREYNHVTLQCPSRFRQVLFHDGEWGAAGFNPSALLLPV